ncbi:hypothetical protein PDE_01130 [Penicillium oxalicum 114-2]|uniref:Uncharacterized protein n=1 Tax=Penicillium oxalicum (strain 114-2 / CGMCC 5302) TaxID=933388 RepID=S7Z7P2_PENO1|nr:hypothetical protein PDE_01130 [Penicillium oxalicum 114-2]
MTHKPTYLISRLEYSLYN